MTREEAKEILTHNRTRVDNPNYSESELDEAFFMAIEALSEPRGDLISREDAIDAICKSWCYVTYMDCPHADDGFRCDGCDDIEAIKALPSALADIGDYADRLWKIAYERGKAEAEAVPLRSDCAECSLKAINRKLDEESYEKGYTAGQFADRPKGEWIFKPTDAIDLMFAKPKCSKCGFESSDGGNFCPNCGAIMKGGTT